MDVQNRFRYSLKADFRLTGENGRMRWYIPAYNEIVIGVPPNYGSRAWDQNRAFLGIGRVLGNIGRAEVGYLNQFLGQRSGLVFESNSTLMVTFTSTMPLRSLFGR